MVEMSFIFLPLSLFFDQFIDFLPQGVRLVDLAVDIVLGEDYICIV